MATTVSEHLGVLRSAAFKQKEMGILLAAMMALFLALLVPLPPLVMDFMLACNITLSIIILMTVIYVRSPLELSSFPSILLGITLFRLTLNIATTRLILGGTSEKGLDRAGHLVLTFSSFITGSADKRIGIIIGFIIFVIFIVVQFVVITKGSGRIAEVAARFTLDAMPGKQMAIDADLNAGIIDETEARRRREDLARQADFYGAMDGAAKFVRGDAIASIIITAINLIFGLVVGMAIMGKGFLLALEEFTRLTIGDGLVTQIPALIVSVASGLIITRGESGGHLGEEVVHQIFTRRVPVAAGGIALLVLGVAMPSLWQLSLFGIGLLFMAYKLPDEEERARRAPRAAVHAPGAGGAGAKGKGAAAAEAAKGKTGGPLPEDVTGLLKLDQVELEVGYALIPLVDATQGGDLLERITMMRRQLALEMGMLVKPIRVRDNMQLPPNDYSIKLYDAEIAHGMALPDQFLAMDSGVVTEKVQGIETVEPAFGLPAVWIPESLREAASLNGYTVVDATTVISTHLTEVVKSHASEILSRQAVAEMLEELKKTSSAIVDEVKERLRLSEIQAVLKQLLREKVSVRNMEIILETLGDYGDRIKDPEILTEYVRARMGRSLCAPFVDDKLTLHCVTVDPELEQLFQKSSRSTEGGSYLALDPDLIQKFIRAASTALERLITAGHHPVVLCSGQVRYHISTTLRSALPNATVLSYNEIIASLKVESLGVIRLPKT